MNFKQKSKGGALIVVVCMFAMLSILIVAIMSTTINGFKLKKEENTRIENFYGSDSGIEIADTVTAQVITKAIEEGNVEAKKITSVNDGEVLYDKKNEAFKKSYTKYIQDNYKTELEKQSNYASFLDSGEEMKITAQITPTVYKSNIIELESKINSLFKDRFQKDREIEVTQKILIPNYGESSLISNSSIGDEDLIKYLVATDGNFYIDHNGSTTVRGDMWIKGRKDDINYQNRFDNGVHITGNPAFKGSTLDWFGKLITKEAINIENSNLEIDQIYARDMILKSDATLKKQSKHGAGNKDLDSGVWIYNDLFLRGKNIKLDIGDYYGLNDIKDTKNNVDQIHGSSGIIINSEDFGNGSEIKAESINLAGTAYLGNEQTDSLLNYQTGESIVINRNTAPYTERNDSGIYKYSYKNPLHIIDEIYRDSQKDYQTMELQDKIKLVEDYYKISKYELDEFNQTSLTAEERSLFNGIQATKMRNVGVAYNNGNAVKGNNTDGFDLSKNQEKYVEEVLLRGENIDSSEASEYFWNPEKTNVTLQGSVNAFEINKIIKSSEIKNKKDDIVFKKVGNQSINNFGIFKSNGTVKDILVCDNENHPSCTKKCVPPGHIQEIKDEHVKVILNTSGKKIVMESSKEIDDNAIISGDKIKVKFDFANEVGIVISLAGADGDATVEIVNDKANHVVGLPIWNTGDVIYTLKGSANIGSYHNNKDTLENMLELIFNFDTFKPIINAGDSGNGGDISSTEENINITDVISDKKWKLIK